MFSAMVRALPIGLLVLAPTRELPQGDWWWKAVASGRLPAGLVSLIGLINRVVRTALGVWFMHEQLGAA